MELTNEFTVPVPVERAWEVLNDVELIAPCLPGAQLQEVEGNEYRGIVKVKVGPITAEYKGAATFREQDLANRKIVLEASGRDTRGQGSASAVITATMTESGSGAGVSTHVVVESDVTIKGKVAQFGRGMIAEVSNKLLTQFVECLEGKLDDGGSASTPAPAETEATAAEPTPTPAPAPEPAPAAEPAPVVAGAPAASTPSPAPTEAAGAGNAAGVRKITHEANEPVDLLDAAGAPLAKRLAPAVVGFLLLLVIGRWRSHRRSS
jgi:carbon monoxide dehydrogenase subunit G